MPMPWEQDYGGTPAAPPPAAGAMPWEKDYPAKPAERSAWDMLTGQGGERYQTWPERLVRGAIDAAVSGATLPRDALEGKVNLGATATDEDIKAAAPRAMNAVSLANPASVASRTGAQIARRAFSPGAPNPAFEPRGVGATPGLEAAQTAADLGAPLPAGLVSENKGVQAATQAARSMPFVGGALDQRVADTIEAAGGRVKGIAEDLSGGVPPDRATAGAGLRPSLQGVIEDNKSRIGAAYDALRHVIDPDQVAELPRTKAAVQGVIARRVDAKMANPTAGLDDVLSLVKQPAKPEIGPTVLRGTEALNDVIPEQPWGASFNGLQRARTAISDKIDFADPHAGFNAGDLKIIRAAMSADMENVVRATARGSENPNARAWHQRAKDLAAQAGAPVEGFSTILPATNAQREAAVRVLRYANAGTSQLIENNRTIQKLLNVKNDEGMVGSVINAAQDKTGNARLLAQLRAQMPKEDFEQVVGVALSELGHNPATGQFSLAKFGTGYRKLSDAAKSILFPDPAHRQALDGIANMDEVLKESDKYINKSGTARAGTLTAGASALAGAAATGNIPGVLGVLGGAAGGYGLAKYLGRPATASTLAKWMKAAQNAPRNGPAGQAMLNVASRNLINNAAPGIEAVGRGALQRLQAPASGTPEHQGPDNGRVADQKPRKAQDRHQP